MDKLLLGVLKKKTKYRELKGSVPTDTIGTTTEYLLRLYAFFFKKNPEASEVDFDALESIIRLKAPTPEAATTALQALEKAREVDITAQQEEFLTQQLQDIEFAGKAARLVNAYNDGEDVDLSYELYKESARIRQLQGATEASKFEAPDVHAILDEQARDVGLKFRQQLLQEGVKGLVAPMSIAICAGVDFGKSSYLADSLTYMAPQAAKMYPGRPIIWFSNEGISREIWPRLYSAALGKTGKELAEMPPEKLYKEYAKALGGDMNLIKLRDAHGWGLSQVAAVVEEMKPCIVVFDMIANFKSSVVTLHEKMESNLQEVREMAAIHDFIAISTVQLSVEGYNNLYPPMTALKESKVGIQGALDVQIMMGRLNDDTYANIRGISTPKNKRKMPGKPTCVKGEVVFYPDKCRFVDN